MCVKVDREERPDVDGIYMDALLAVRGNGGWPLTALLTPDRRPFYLATYLPRRGRPGQLGVIELAEGVQAAWRDDAAGVRKSAADLTATLHALAAPPDDARPLGPDVAAATMRRLADPEFGGFGRAPKFPTPHHAFFLLAHGHQTADEALSDLALEALRAIHRGGIFDQIAGGLHRYATDRVWRLPHFEKMLTDQALYALACTEAVCATGSSDLRDAALETLAYAVRDLRLPSGLFAASEDADSLRADGSLHEGAFYVWTEAELDAVLGDDADLARRAFGTTAEGTNLDEATQRRDGTNVFYRADVAAFSDPRFPGVRARLLEARGARPRPGLDDKALADGNGLMLAALASSARTLDERLEPIARATSDALLATFSAPDGGLWHRAPTATEPGIDGLLDDSAFVVWGLIELYLTSFKRADLDHALRLHAVAEARFGDNNGGYFVSPEGATDLIARRRSRHDGAVPAGASVHVWNALRLGHLTEDTELLEAAHHALALGSDEHASGQTMRLAAAIRAEAPVAIVAGRRGAEDTRALVEALRREYVPGTVIGLREPNDEAPLVGNAGQRMRDGQAMAYICRHGACQEPTADPERAQALLAAMN